MKLSEEQCNMKYPVTWTEFRATLPFSRNWERGQILLDFFSFPCECSFSFGSKAWNELSSLEVQKSPPSPSFLWPLPLINHQFGSLQTLTYLGSNRIKGKNLTLKRIRIISFLAD